MNEATISCVNTVTDILNINHTGNNMVDEHKAFAIDEMNSTGDVDSTAAIVSQPRNNQLLNTMSDNDDTSTIASVASPLKFTSSTGTTTTTSTTTQSSKGTGSTNDAMTIELPPLKPVRYGLSSLLVRRDGGNDEVHADEKKQDDGPFSNMKNTFGIEKAPHDVKEATLDSRVYPIPTQHEDTAAVDVRSNDIDGVSSADHNAIMEDDTKAMIKSTQPEQREPLNAVHKQKNRRDLFMMIHKEVQNPHLKPCPPLPLRPNAMLSKPENVGQDVDSVDVNGPFSELEKSGDGQPLNSPKRRGRPPGHKKKATWHGPDNVAPKRAKRPTVSTLDSDAMIGKPIAPLYAYELFSRDYLRAYMAANRDAADLTQEALNAITLNEWKTMSDQSKKPYVIRATQDQQIYHQQVQLWERNKNPTVNVPPVAATKPSVITKDQSPPRPRGRPKLLKNITETNVDQDFNVNAAATDKKLSPRPRGRPKFGHVWDSPSGQWVKIRNSTAANASDRIETTVAGDNDTGTVLVNNHEDKKLAGQSKVASKDSGVAAAAGMTATQVDENNVHAKEDDGRWYTKLQATPTSINPNDGKQFEEEPKAAARTIGTVPQRALPRNQNILNPKRPPKINHDGSYRKPGGPQPTGYNWNAEYGYWESVIASDANLQRILDFDHDEEEEKLVSNPPVRRQSTGSVATMAQRKRKYTEDGCIVPRQTLERLADGTYARPLGRPIVGYGWDFTRGLWVPSSQMDHRHSLSSLEQKAHRRKMSAASAGNKTRLYTSDGCILPMKTPTKSNDGSFVRPFGRSIVGYTWDYHRGVWAPTGDPIPTKNAMPLPPSHFVGPIRLADKLVEDCKFMACTKCDACHMKENCGTCLHCKILEGHSKKATIPYLVCSFRICQEPVLNPKFTEESSVEKVPNKESNADSDDDMDEYDDENDEYDDDQLPTTENGQGQEQASVDNDDIDEDDSILESLSDDDGNSDNMMTDIENE